MTAGSAEHDPAHAATPRCPSPGLHQQGHRHSAGQLPLLEGPLLDTPLQHCASAHVPVGSRAAAAHRGSSSCHTLLRGQGKECPTAACWYHLCCHYLLLHGHQKRQGLAEASRVLMPQHMMQSSQGCWDFAQPHCGRHWQVWRPRACTPSLPLPKPLQLAAPCGAAAAQTCATAAQTRHA